VPDLLVIFKKTADLACENHLHAVNALFFVNPARFKIADNGKDPDALLLEPAAEADVWLMTFD